MKTLKKKPLPPKPAAKKKTLKKKVVAAEPPKKKMLKAPVKQPAAPKTGPVATIPTKFKFKGNKDKAKSMSGKGYKHVAPDDMPDTFPRPHRLIAPNTFWRVDPAKPEAICAVTILLDGVHVAWAECGVCINTLSRCVCKNGWLHNRGVEWLYIRARMRVEGSALGSEPNIDSTNWEVTSRGLYWYQGRNVSAVPTKIASRETPRRVVTAPQPSPAPGPRQTPAKPQTGQKRALSKADTAPLDLQKINKAAETSADDLSKSLAKSLAKPAPKKLKKRK